MPRLSTRPPKMSRVKSTGDAVVYVNRQRKYLGPWDSEQARRKYNEFLEAWAANSGRFCEEPTSHATIVELVARFLDYSKQNLDFRDHNNYKTASRPLVAFFGTTTVEKFGPKALAFVQQQFVATGYSRGYCNKLTNFIRTIFRWGVAQEMVLESVAAALKYVPPLRKGRTMAPESLPRQEVPDEVVERTLPYLFPTVAAMVQVQRLAAMRPNEVCRMKVGEIETSGDIWIYCPIKHKGTWRGHGKAVALGRPEQEILLPRMTGKEPEHHVFSPKTALAEKADRDAARRKTKVQPSQVERHKECLRNPKSRARDHYDSQSYARSIKYAIERANKQLLEGERIPHWTPYQLRHAAVTEITLENNGDLNVARAVAGQKSISVTQNYNHADLKIAIEQAKKRSKKKAD